MSLPVGSCSYWRRQAVREADREVGPVPFSERVVAADLRADADDPPCGSCHACLASERTDAVVEVLDELPGAGSVFEDGDWVSVDLSREPDLLAMGPLLDRLRAAGAQAVRMERWEVGSGDEVSSGPRLVVWVVPEGR